MSEIRKPFHNEYSNVSANPMVVNLPANLTVGNSYRFLLSPNIPYIQWGRSQFSSSFTITSNCPPCPTALTLESTSTPSEDVTAGAVVKVVNTTTGVIMATNKITGPAQVTYRGAGVTLNPGFLSEQGTVFRAEQGGCN
jgi:hypothetical protein